MCHLCSYVLQHCIYYIPCYNFSEHHLFWGALALLMRIKVFLRSWPSKYIFDVSTKPAFSSRTYLSRPLEAWQCRFPYYRECDEIRSARQSKLTLTVIRDASSVVLLDRVACIRIRHNAGWASCPHVIGFSLDILGHVDRDSSELCCRPGVARHDRAWSSVSGIWKLTTEYIT